MARATHGRRGRTVVAILGSAIAILALGGAPAGAAAGACSARDGSSGAWTSDLSAVLAAAHTGDVIHIRGTCTGNFTVTVPLTLSGDLMAVLNGAGHGTVLTIDVPSGTVSIKTLEVTGGSAPVGGGIAADPGVSSSLTLSLLYARIIGNTAGTAGAGLDAGRIAALDITESLFKDDTITPGSEGAEGAAIASGAPGDFDLSNILSNAATAAPGQTVTGGAVYLTARSTLYGMKIEDTTVSGGVIDGAGLGATASVTVGDSTVEGNKATTSSGAIAGVGVYAAGPTAAIEHTATFGNIATSGSGAIEGTGVDAASSTALSFSGSSVGTNLATTQSGLIRGVGVAGGAQDTLSDSGVVLNQGSSTTGTVDGGGIAPGGSLSMTGGMIDGNTVKSVSGLGDGGGIWTSVPASISGAQVDDNSASTAGGGAYLAAGALTITGSQFVGNTAPTGSAIDNVGGTVTATGSLIDGSCVGCS